MDNNTSVAVWPNGNGMVLEVIIHQDQLVLRLMTIHRYTF